MKKGIGVHISLACLLGLILFLASSCVYVSGCDGWSQSARYERQVELSAPLIPGSAFAAETRDGSITLEGVESAECRLVATIRAWAKTEEKAEELGEQIEVSLAQTAEGLEVVIDAPKVIRNAHYGVSLNGSVPTQTNLRLVTSDGSVQLANFEGTVDATTSDGSVDAERITGDTRLKTSDGRIQCAEVDADTLELHTSDGSIKMQDVGTVNCTARTSDGSITLTNVRAESLELRTSDGTIRCEGIATARLNCRTSDGSVHIECTPDAPTVMDASVTTSDGSITFTAPPGLSAVIDASTSDGGINTTLPITVTGKVDKSLHGTIGAGEGRLVLRTDDGSITIK